MHSVTVNLHISAEEYLRVYQGTGKVVVARDLQGRTVRFPAKILQPFVGHHGISGCFKITFSDHGKFQTIEKLASY